MDCDRDFFLLENDGWEPAARFITSESEQLLRLVFALCGWRSHLTRRWPQSEQIQSLLRAEIQQTFPRKPLNILGLCLYSVPSVCFLYKCSCVSAWLPAGLTPLPRSELVQSPSCCPLCQPVILPRPSVPTHTSPPPPWNKIKGIKKTVTALLWQPQRETTHVRPPALQHNHVFW